MSKRAVNEKAVGSAVRTFHRVVTPQPIGRSAQRTLRLGCKGFAPVLGGLLAVVLVSGGLSPAGAQIIPPDAGVPVIDWKDAGKYVDQEVTVQGRIIETRNIKTICFLNFDSAHSFTAIVRKGNFDKFPTPAEELYRNKVLRIRGVISEYRGKPQIELRGPDQITVLDDPDPVPPPAPSDGEERTFDGIVTVATYNAYNLFDEHDDPYHSDEGTPAKPREQLEKLATTIRQIDADVLAMQEIENRPYLERFVKAMLGGMGYDHVVCFEGNDRRGIDCAVLSRFPVGPVTSYRHVRFSDGSGGMAGFRRDLLQVRIEPPGCKPFDVFVVHLKSKLGGARETTGYRVAEATQALKIMENLLDRDKQARFLICGDFNDTWDSRPLKILNDKDRGVLRNFVADLPEGAISLNSRRHKDLFDYIFASPALAAHYVPKSYRIIPGSVETSGSDHNPVLAKFDLGSGK